MLYVYKNKQDVTSEEHMPQDSALRDADMILETYAEDYNKMARPEDL